MNDLSILNTPEGKLIKAIFNRAYDDLCNALSDLDNVKSGKKRSPRKETVMDLSSAKMFFELGTYKIYCNIAGISYDPVYKYYKKLIAGGYKNHVGLKSDD